MGASEAALGTVNPDNTSAIIAVQNATAAPLELTKMEFYRFTEDWARAADLDGAHYGVRTLVLPNEDGGEPEIRVRPTFRNAGYITPGWMSARQATGPKPCRR